MQTVSLFVDSFLKFFDSSKTKKQSYKIIKQMKKTKNKYVKNTKKKPKPNQTLKYRQATEMTNKN